MKKNKIKKHFKKAFTLVELIIVIAVIAILAVFLIPNFSNVLGDANATNVKSDTANIKNIVMAYISEVGAVPVANISTTAGQVIKITSGADTYYPGISTAMFQNTAAANKYYVIDMDLLTNKQINIEDKVSVTSAKLASIPGTSAIVNTKSGDTADKIGTGTGNDTLDTNKRIKNTSVTYVIDKDLNVYAAYSKNIKTSSKDANTVIDGSAFDLLTDEGTVQHATFKTASKTLQIGDVLYGLAVDDSNYN